MLLLLGSFAGMLPTPTPAGVNEAAALSNPLYWPVAAGASWTVGQGYNTKTTEGGSHWGCNPKTLKDAPTATLACRAHYQYQFALDLARSDTNTVGQAVLAPADGSITWTELATGGGVIDLGDGYAFGFFHLRLDPAIVAGAQVVRGQRLGTVAPPGEANNGGWPHLHVNLWQSSDGGNWDRNSVPFSGAYALGGLSMPNQGAGNGNQYRGTTFVSTNTQVGSDASTPVPVRPGIPVQVSPANGVAITRQNPTTTMVWRTVSGANEYQVVLDDGTISSPWVIGTTWTTPILTSGQHVWQVRSRNYAGQSALSVKWLLFVNTSGVPSGGPSPSATASPSTGVPATGLTALPVGGAVTTTIALRGGGFSASEAVRITLDTVNGPLLSTTTAASDGSINTGITIGNATRGAHSLIARGQTSGRQQATTYTVAPSLARAPLNGPPGTVATVTARGFAANETVRLTWLSATGPVLAELTTAANGTGTAAFPLPDAARGWHDYSGLGLTSGARAWGNFGIDSGLSLSAETAAPGQAITATARGFGAAQAVTFTWNKSPASAGTTLCIITTNSTGRATCPITVPAGSGVFPVTATVADGTSQAVSVRVGGGLSVSVSPASGAVGSTVQVSAGGFTANEAVDLRWDSSSIVTRVTANSSGTVSRLMTVPFLSYGNHALNLVGQVSGRSASTTYAVSQSVAVNPTGGASGTSVSLSAQGMPAGQLGTAYWNRTSGSGGTVLCSARVTPSGTFACSFSVPTATANTTYPVSVIAGSVSANASYRVSGTGTGGPVGPPSAGNGTFVVNATREGLVGGTTSSGHVIQPLDRFVSLPACTASSCSWLAPGVAHSLWGIRTECGSACYVRIINPANNRCIVAPIEDTGPWFTQDDWWNPTSSRFLNTLSTNPNILRQGYPGAQAARDGLDVGYGVAPSGIGISNKGYEVGNSSAIDIGDGSWVDLGFNIAGASAGGLTVTMLWQSGENPNAAAQACGQSSANPPPGAGGGTGTPQPSVAPTATPRPGTATPRPATATPRPATATPRPGTATPRPATATPRPATQTPRTPTATPRPPRGSTATPRPATATARPRTATPSVATATPPSPTREVRTPTPTVQATRRPRTTPTPRVASFSVPTETAQPQTVPENEPTATPSPASPDQATLAAGTAQPQVPVVVISTETPTNIATSTTEVTAEPAATNAALPAMTAESATATPADVTVTLPTIASTSTIVPAEPTSEVTPTDPVVLDPILILDPTVEPTAAPSTEVATTAPIDPTEPASDDDGSAEELTTPTTMPESPVDPSPTTAPTFESTATVEPTATSTEEPTATPTEEPTATLTEEPTATPSEEPTATLVPVPETQVQTIYPVADTSVTSTSPDTAQSPDLAGGLTFGGPDGAVSYLTFDASSVAAPGSVVLATLTLTGYGANGATGGELLAIPGAYVDEYGATWNTRPIQPVSAIDQYGSPVWIDWVVPGGSVTIDVTGTVASSGLVTFVLIGLPDSATSVGSRESGVPPYLTVETVVYSGG